MRKHLVIVVCLALFPLLAAAEASAKEGFYIGAFVPSESISGNAGSGTSSGSGWGARAGYGFNKYFAIEANYATTSHNLTVSSTDLKSLAADVKISFPLTSLDSAQVMTLMPYFLAGYAHYEQNTPSSSKSDGAQWGFGVELYLFRELSVQAGWTTTSVSFKNNAFPFNDLDGDVRRVDIGLIYHFE